ncbi:FAD-binding protein [Edaphovirga cremea]|uniref:FAD-binding protein n=1 Tax=Edaphovirga cremea TaxID=2267246 RepID=UPI003989C743
MSKLPCVWVFSDSGSKYPELIAAGKVYADQVNAINITALDNASQAFAYGADRVFQFNYEDDTRLIEDYALSFAQLISAGQQPTALFMNSTSRCKAIAGKLSVLLKAGVINDVSSVKLDEQKLIATRMVYGGLALSEERIDTPIAIITLSAESVEPLPEDPAKTGEIIPATFVEPVSRIKCIGRQTKQGERTDLRQAQRVVGVGRGLSAKEDLQMIEELCVAIGAEMGCTRPIAEGEKWVDPDRYIGVSGVMLKPDVYLALGVSGQIQHMVGINGAQTIIAVNKDKNAPIFQKADYGLVGDLYKVVPAILAAYKN